VSAFPLRYAHGNILFGRGDERLALYRVETISYPFKSQREKVEWLRRLAQFAFAAEADFSLWRVCRAYPVDRYVEQALALLDDRMQREVAWRRYLEGHELHLHGLASHLPEVYIGVSLRAGPPTSFGGALLRASDRTRRRLEDLFGVAAHQPVSGRELDSLLAAEERALGRVAAAFGRLARRATTRELQWLLRRAATRGVAEPRLDRHWEPDALVIEGEGGEVLYEPLETDLARHANAPVLEEDRTLVCDAEEGRSFQAMLALGALPEQATFPGEAELLCAPLEAVDFPVDAVLHARWTGNRRAIGQVRKRILDADNVYSDQLTSDHGPLSFQAEENRELARELDAYLQSQAHPPLLEASVALAVGAPSRAELERRVAALEDQYGTIALHRPAGLQPALFFDHLPRAGGGTVPDYREILTIEQFGALMPLGTVHAGSERGVYIGETVSGGRRPVKFDVTEASRRGRTPSILLAGTLGSGKTIAAELLAYQAERRGSLVVDVDPKPDHNLEGIPELEGRVEVIEISGQERFRGMLDPLRIAPPSIREEVASAYLVELLPAAPPSWETYIRKAVREAIGRGQTSSLAVLDALERSDQEEARNAAEALGVWADSGLGRLAFGEGGDFQLTAERPITTIKARGLSLPAPEVARADYDQAERLSVATLKLVAAYAMRLVSGDRSVHKLVLFDEAWFLLGSRDGQRLIQQLNRLGRTENATLVLATQQLGDVGEIENLIGTRLIFGLETAAEARRGLSLLGLDPDDQALVERLRSYRTGRCLMRDIDDRTAAVQIDPVYEELLDALDTSPGGRAAERVPA
jgi:hypothetical protein